MTKSTRLAIAGIGFVMFIAVGFVVFGPDGFLTGGPPAGGPPEIPITVFLVDDLKNGGCVVQSPSKTDAITVRGERRQIRWTINHDACKDKQALVTLGNFRRSETTSARDCREAKAPGADGIWLFAQPEGRQHRQSHSVIPLTTKGQNELEERTYHYDICTGADADKKADPRLVIDY